MQSLAAFLIFTKRLFFVGHVSHSNIVWVFFLNLFWMLWLVFLMCSVGFESILRWGSVAAPPPAAFHLSLALWVSVWPSAYPPVFPCGLKSFCCLVKSSSLLHCFIFLYFIIKAWKNQQHTKQTKKRTEMKRRRKKILDSASSLLYGSLLLLQVINYQK